MIRYCKTMLLVLSILFSVMSLTSCEKYIHVDYETMSTQEILTLTTKCSNDTAEEIVQILPNCGVDLDSIKRIGINEKNEIYIDLEIIYFSLSLILDSDGKLSKIYVLTEEFLLYNNGEYFMTIANMEVKEHYIELMNKVKDNENMRVRLEGPYSINQGFSYTDHWTILQKDDEVYILCSGEIFQYDNGKMRRPTFSINAIFNRDRLISFDIGKTASYIN